MRAIGKRSIAFGLVSVPVKIYTATEDHDIALHQVHDADGGRIRYERRCEVCGRVIPYEHIDRAYDAGDRRVILEEEELAALPEASREDVEVVEFVPSDQVDPISFERSYYLEPERGATKAYVLLRETLQRTERTAIVRFALRNKTHLGALRVHGNALVLQGLLWGNELRKADFPALEKAPKVTAKEQELADSLVRSLERDFDPDEYRDEYQEQLRELIEAKLDRGDAVEVEEAVGARPEPARGGEVIDLMEALRRSVGEGRAAKPTAKAPVQKAPAKKAAPKKAAGKATTKKSADAAAKTPARKATRKAG